MWLKKMQCSRWRTSYFCANYTRAAQVWERALSGYPASRSAFSALYQLGECYRRQADADLDSHRGLDFSPLNGRRDLEWGIQRHGYLLEAAAAKFDKLANDIQAKRAGGARLSEFEADLLRKSLFALAECRFEHSQFVDARPLYERLAADYRERIEGLQALQQLYLSYLVSTPPDKDKAAEWLREYERVLADLPDSAFAGRLEHESRPAFENWLKNQKAVLEKFNLYADPKKSKIERLIASLPRQWGEFAASSPTDVGGSLRQRLTAKSSIGS